MNMSVGYFVNAICTPLEDDESVHVGGLEAHLADQWDHGIEGVLAAGNMGQMPLLRDETWRQLITESARLCADRGELLVGAGDMSFERTRHRIEFVNGHDVDGVVVMTPYYAAFSQPRLVEYYLALADIAKAPLYLYDLPAVAGVGIAMETYLAVREHPNIQGTKISGRFDFARQLMSRLRDTFRIIIAEPLITDVTLRSGFSQQLDGIYSILPAWLEQLRAGAAAGHWDQAAHWQRRITHVRNVMLSCDSPMSFATAILNARGIEGKCHVRPAGPLSDAEREQVFEDSVIKELIEAGATAPA
ncbi:MAG: dihydrodipicolinate synthase family protein [Phycisphaeraceae bacterium]|nr:dihydrodipicolinate synthase family protein [Phycisphaeraceae bacterium]